MDSLAEVLALYDESVLLSQMRVIEVRVAGAD